MKICLINNLYKPYNRGGAEKAVEMMAADFISNGHKVFIIATKPYTWAEKSENKLDFGQIPVYRINSFYYNLNFLPFVIRIFWHVVDMLDFISARKIKKIIEKEKPDIVVTHNLKGISYLTPVIISSLGIKHLHILHDVQLFYASGLMIWGQEHKAERLPAKIYSLFNCMIFKTVNTVVSPSYWLLDQHIKRGFFKNSKKVVVPLFAAQSLSAAKSASTCDNKMQKKSDFVFLYAGQLEKHKGVAEFIKAVNLVNENLKHKPLKFLIAGRGKLLSQIQSVIPSNTLVIDALQPIDMINLMFKADCLVVPSLCYENSPMVVHEAISVNLPVLTSNIGGLFELTRKCGGLFAIPGDYHDLAEKMIWIYRNYQKFSKLVANHCEKIKKDAQTSVIDLL